MLFSFRYSVIFTVNSFFAHELLINVCLSVPISREEKALSTKLYFIVHFQLNCHMPSKHDLGCIDCLKFIENFYVI